MPRNTFILVSILAVIAALIVGVNAGRFITGDSQSKNADKTPEPSVSIPPVIKYIFYKNTVCGISFSVPEDYRTLESTGGSTLFIKKEDPSQSVTLICQNSLPPMAEASGSASRIMIGSVSAMLSSVISEKGVSVRSLDIIHPKTDLNIRISGPRSIFEEILKSVTLL